MLRSLGADEVVDYAREDFTQRGAFIGHVPGDPGGELARRLAEFGRWEVVIDDAADGGESKGRAHRGSDGAGGVGRAVVWPVPA